MSGLLDGVNLRTELVGHNRLEILLFFLNGKQSYGINVFKVHEVIQRPGLTRLPNAHPTICGVATLRGRTIPIFDLAKAIGQPPLMDREGGIVVITEYNRSLQGFLVRAVDRIVNINWEQVVPPPQATGCDHFLTAVAHVDKEMVAMIDVERVLGNVSTVSKEVNITASKGEGQGQHMVLVVDDSLIARNQVKKTLDKLSINSILCNNGREAYERLMEWQEHDPAMIARLTMVISDIEMPEMDGYTLTTKIRSHEALRNLYVMLHTSLSGLFNNDLIRKVDADAFVPKFDPMDLANAILKRIEELNGKTDSAA